MMNRGPLGIRTAELDLLIYSEVRVVIAGWGAEQVQIWPIGCGVTLSTEHDMNQIPRVGAE